MTVIYASGDDIVKVQQQLHKYVTNISIWYRMNCLMMDIDKTKVMPIGSKDLLNSLNIDDFALSYENTPLGLVQNAKCLRMFITCNIS